jgi:lipid-binding SYLF domain-containing protein
MGKSHTPFLDDARKRAQSLKQAQQASPNHEEGHPLEYQQRQHLLQSQLSPVVVVRTPVNADKARMEWRQHREGVSQASEEKRRPLSSMDTVVRILAVETRSDVNGSNFSAYVISVLRPGLENAPPILVEHRYSDFDKLNSMLRKHNVQLGAVFPSKHWAGRLGNWTPSLSVAPIQHQDLISYRKIQLDLWLVDLVAVYNRGQLPPVVHQEVTEFLIDGTKAPCDRENDLDQSTSVERSLRLINPLSFTLGSSIRQASYTVQYMCSRGIIDSDKSIPLDLIQQAVGLCFFTVMKAGLVVSGKIGTGLVVSRRPDGSWSAPSALGTVGLGWGAQIGGDITHYLIVLTSRKAVDSFAASSSVTLGAEFGVAIGPVGRGATSHVSSSSLLQPAYAYAHSQGLFVGISLEGSIINARHDLNTKFYGRQVNVEEILKYMDAPRAAKPLYHALNHALAQDIPVDGIRPSTLFNSHSFDSPPVKQVSGSTTALASSSPALICDQSPTMSYPSPINERSRTWHPTLPAEGISHGQASLCHPNKF